MGDYSSKPVAVDAMGGDEGVLVQVEGALQAYQEEGIKSILIGDEEQISAHLDALGAPRSAANGAEEDSSPLKVHHAPDVITMEESPTRAVRKKPNSSLCVGYSLLKKGEASSLISAGNSGAVMAAGGILCGRLPGIERPAIASIVPAMGGTRPNIILDAGANVECHAHHLVQFAIMGSIYYGSLFGVDEPRVGVLSNGEEPSKGTDITRAVALTLSQMKNLNYIGYVEGRDLATKKAEVFVCDGFVGNLVLKAMEGCAKMVIETLKEEAQKQILGKAGLALCRGVIRDVYQSRFDYSAYGGAPLLGLKKLVLVLHGSSGARAVKNAIRMAKTFAESHMTEKIADAIGQHEEQVADLEDGIIGSVISSRKHANLDTGES